MYNVFHEDGEFVSELKRIVEDQKFRIKASKTRLQKVGQRQEVPAGKGEYDADDHQQYPGQVLAAKIDDFFHDGILPSL